MCVCFWTTLYGLIKLYITRIKIQNIHVSYIDSYSHPLLHIFRIHTQRHICVCVRAYFLYVPTSVCPSQGTSPRGRADERVRYVRRPRTFGKGMLTPSSDINYTLILCLYVFFSCLSIVLYLLQYVFDIEQVQGFYIVFLPFVPGTLYVESLRRKSGRRREENKNKKET